MQHFKLLMYMKKPKPWRTIDDNDENKMSCCEMTRNINRICRLLMINHAPSILSICSTPRINKKKCRKRKAEPPFLIRNCINGQKNWESYTQKLQNWTQRLYQKRRNGSTSYLSVKDQSHILCSDNQLENVSDFASVSTTATALLRSFYTIWHIGRISKKPLKTNEETEKALKELSASPVVEKSLRLIPKGGITAEVITDKSQLSERALYTLSRWARITEDVMQDGHESGYDDDPVEIWNRAITFADTSYTGSELNSVIRTTSATAETVATSFLTSTDESTPKRRRSNRVLKTINLKV